MFSFFFFFFFSSVEEWIAHMIVKDGCVSIEKQPWVNRYPKDNTSNELTQPSVIKLRSSVNCKTSSSSSIVHVSLVDVCFGINNVVTEYLWPLSFPNSNPQVSLFISVFTLAIARKRGRHSLGRLTLLRGFVGSKLGSEVCIIRLDSVCNWDWAKVSLELVGSGGGGRI